MRAIHVANHYKDRLYYLVDDEEGHDGAILRANADPIFIQFWAYVTKVAGDKGWKQLSNTKFHDFLWHGQEGDLESRWLKVFGERRLEPRKELLLSVPVITEFPQRKKDKRKKVMEKHSNRALEFKILTSAGLHEKALGRGIGRDTRRVVQRAMRSVDFDPNPVDADMDGIGQEGTIYERIIHPSAPHAPRAVRRARQGLASSSQRTARWDWRRHRGNADRYIDGTPDEYRATLQELHKTVEDLYHGGEPIGTYRQMQDALMVAHKGFRDGTSKADFAGNGKHFAGNGAPVNKDSALNPLEREVGYALLYNLSVSPLLQEADLNVASYRNRALNNLEQSSPGADGWAGYRHGLLFKRDKKGKLVLDKDRKPKIEIGYKADTPRGSDGKHHWDPETDTIFSPRSDPRAQVSPMDTMAMRTYITMMDELNDPTQGEDGWEEDPNDNWTTPHTTTGVPTPTRRSIKTKRQHEEAVRQAVSNIGHHEFTHAAHYMAQRDSLIKAIEKDLGPGPVPLAELDSWIRSELPGRMTPTQKRLALRATPLRQIGERISKSSAMTNAAFVEMVDLENAALDDPSIHPKALANRLGLELYLDTPITDPRSPGGKPIVATEGIAALFNSHPIFRHRILEDKPPAKVKVGDAITREQILNVFGSRHYFYDSSGSRPVVLVPTPHGVAPLQSSPWALADTGINPLAQRSLTEVDPALAISGLQGDALDIMLESGTPEIQISRVRTMTGDYVYPDGAGSIIVPALSQEDTSTLVTAAGQVAGQTPHTFDASNPPEFLGANLGMLTAQNPDPQLPSLAGNNVNGLDLIDPALPDVAVDSLIREEIGNFIDVTLDSVVAAKGEEYGRKHISAYLETIGMSAFHWDDLDEDEINAMTSLIKRLGIPGTVRDREVAWTPYMGSISQLPRFTDALNIGLSARYHEFFAELGGAQARGTTINAPQISSTERNVLEKLTKWMKSNEKFRAKTRGVV